MRRRSATTRLVRAIAARLGAAMLACVLLIGVLRGGKSYFFCPMMSAVFDAPCCGDDGAEDEDDVVSEVRTPDCCQAKRVGTVPSSALSSVPDVSASPCVAVLPARCGDDGFEVGATAVRYTQPARAGPLSANERRARLMVWLS